MTRSWLLRLRPSFRSLGEIRADAEANRQFDLQYLVMLVLSCLIALLGLMLNSPAVIIGAMLISPLMGPILACGLALTIADGNTGKKAAFNTLVSIAEVIIIATIATALIPLKDATPEILVRTNPNLMDLLVAFFSGLAGTLALCAARGGMTILPGVAIATAVMPPLATTGYGISTGQWNVAGGAFMLFFTNLTAIIISADIVFLWVGFRPHDDKKERHRFLLRYRVAAAVVILGLLSVPLLQTLTQAVNQARMRKEVRAVIVERLEKKEKARLSAFALGIPAEGPLLVEATVRTTQVLSPAAIRDLERDLQSRLQRPVRLDLQQVQLAVGAIDRDHQNYLAGGLVSGGRTPRAPEILAPQNALPIVRGELEDVLRPLRLTALDVDGVTMDSANGVTVSFTATQPTITPMRAWEIVAAALQSRVGAPVRMNARVRVTDVPRVVPNFADESARLGPVEQRRLRAYFASLEERGLTPRLLRPAAPDELHTRRVAALAAFVPGMEIENGEAAGLELVAVQVIQAFCCEAEAAPPPK